MRTTRHRSATSSVTWLLRGAWVVAALAGCASYEPAQLASEQDFVKSVDRLEVDRATLTFRSLRDHPFDPRDGFDMTEIAMLAVANNPDLRIARADAGLSGAQAFAAGLLPDPQLALSRDHQLGFPAGASIAFSAGLTYDLQALVTHRSLAAAADADTRKAELNLLWMEWQTVAQARLLFVKARSFARTVDVLEKARDAFADRYARVDEAARRNLISSDAVAPHLTALQDLDRQLHDARRQLEQNRHELNAYVGIAPDVQLLLVDGDDLASIRSDEVRARLKGLLATRPDLVALQRGYEAEDDRYRGALLAQFPSFTFGPQRARDTTNVNTTGFTLGITLPVFNGNRGNIAIEKATRAKLRVEYQGRIDAATVEIERLLDDQDLLERNLADIHQALRPLTDAADRALQAFAAHDVDALTLTNAQVGLLNKQIEEITTRESLAEQRLSILTLAGPDVPMADAHTPNG